MQIKRRRWQQTDKHTDTDRQTDRQMDGRTLSWLNVPFPLSGLNNVIFFDFVREDKRVLFYFILKPGKTK